MVFTSIVENGKECWYIETKAQDVLHKGQIDTLASPVIREFSLGFIWQDLAKSNRIECVWQIAVYKPAYK